jgi:hypothetical protein
MITDPRYLEKRARVEQFFVPENRMAETAVVTTSPCGKYTLEACQYRTRSEYRKYTRGVVSTKDGQIADIKRNYSSFWHAWAYHPKGEYLLCGEDYQGQSIVNLQTEKITTYFPDAGFNGSGFCWAAAWPSANSAILAVHGCVWGGPYDVRFYDFSSPEEFPYTQLAWVAADKAAGWQGDTFVYSIQVPKAVQPPEDSDEDDCDTVVKHFRLDGQVASL